MIFSGVLAPSGPGATSPSLEFLSGDLVAGIIEAFAA
jgi:hypothetical protein